jgi:hypothetical protein
MGWILLGERNNSEAKMFDEWAEMSAVSSFHSLKPSTKEGERGKQNEF